MSKATIFPVHSLRRGFIHWEDHIQALTPIEEIEGVTFKREDRFAPLGYGGVNGSKLRQLIWLGRRYVDEGAEGILTGCSVLSPQASMTALVGYHLGLPVSIVLGATNPRSAVKHENVAIADAVGAQFEFAPVAYNPALQREVARLEETDRYAGWARLPYAIAPSEEADDEFLLGFHGLGALQVANLPPRRTLVVPAGSCMTCTGIIFGLARLRPAWLERLVLVVIGPGRQKWMSERLERLAQISGVDGNAYLNEIDVRIHDLHGTGYARYADKMPWHLGPIDFHPTYEGKVMRYMHEKGYPLDGGDTTFWIVGSEPTRAGMLDAFMLDGLPVDWAIA